ncbi:purine nucleosidase/non-specific riboncleoside hydrolase [Devosia crocina]|uniref:Purine nucleosidase/non-specific riboncleoside hydrolase n=1 Tax=Devosia crocina TaxID=429728 RepID=A0A1I7NPU6_9HYPH|nr:nucleoside hydrolase [Devosia crocina]SFV36659.1 purine nucleosidase/non-specific riboncleoside hydrolase [Devosia crocina]
MTRKLILDTDGGVDDAQALLMLIANGRTPDAITTVFGNVGLDAATRNILTVLQVAGKDTVPVHKGADRPLTQPVIDAKYIHGDDGLGGAPRPATIPEVASTNGIGFLIDTFRAAAGGGEQVDLLMIGPLTNLALALRLAPDIVEGIGQLTIMGATVYGRGNTTPAAEFNIYADPEAAAIVFGADVETLVAPWEPCVTHFMTGEEVEALLAEVPDSPEKTFSAALVGHARRTTIGYGGPDHFRFVDPLAIAAVIEPDLVTKTLQASVDVALAPGITRGMTVVDPSGRLGTPPVTLIEEARVDRLIALYRNSVAYRAS